MKVVDVFVACMRSKGLIANISSDIDWRCFL